MFRPFAQIIMLKLTKTNKNINLIVALGNVGNEYLLTRHNAGFLFADSIRRFLNDQGYETRTEREKDYILTKFSGLELSILQPTTMMNSSGRAVQSFLKYHSNKHQISSLMLAHDDLDLGLDTYKLQFAKAPKNHNGITSVENELGTKDFFRLRIGIENRELEDNITGMEYVLKKFTQTELQTLESLYTRIIEREISIV